MFIDILSKNFVGVNYSKEGDKMKKPYSIIYQKVLLIIMSSSMKRTFMINP